MNGKIPNKLKAANLRFQNAYPGDRSERQPVHVVYGGAHLFRADTPRKLASIALRSLREYAPTAEALARCLGWSAEKSHVLYPKIIAKLEREAIEDYRIDFEDGYGIRSDEEEDRHAREAAVALAQSFRQGALPPFIGIRVKSFTNEFYARSSRTLQLFLDSLLKETHRKLPENFVITLPKVCLVEQVDAMHASLSKLEAKHRLKRSSLRLEIMVEAPQSLFDPEGSVLLPDLVDAAKGRCRGVHFGTYDYTAACDVTAPYQTMDHPAAQFAKHVMQASLACRGLMLSDGATTVMPIGPHRTEKDAKLTPQQTTENVATVHSAWRMSYDNVRMSLAEGFYQGWDLHPAQVPMRYAAIYSFFDEGMDATSARLRNFIEKAAQATRVGDAFDDAATGQGLLNFFLRAVSCGAIGEAEACERSGLSTSEIRSRSFLTILKDRS